MGLARTGSSASNGSGDYVLAFSTAEAVRRRVQTPATGNPVSDRRSTIDLTNDAMSALFQAAVEATEEAIYNSMLRAVTVRARGRTVEALPIDRVREILRKYNVAPR